MKMYNLRFFRLLTIYWMLHGICLFLLAGFGDVTKIVAGIILLISLLMFVFKTVKYMQFYSIVMLIYSVIYMVLIAIVCLFFPPAFFV